jgi:hypothetical protein
MQNTPFIKYCIKVAQLQDKENSSNIQEYFTTSTSTKNRHQAPKEKENTASQDQTYYIDIPFSSNIFQAHTQNNEIRDYATKTSQSKTSASQWIR